MDRLTCGWAQMRRGAPPLTSLLTRRAGGPRGRSRGQAMVEFALVAPLFLMLLFGVIEYSLINASVGTLNFAAKEGARYGAIVGKASIPNQPPVDQYVVNSIIVPRVAGIVVAQMQKIEIFNATETGACVLDSKGVCEEDIWQPAAGGTWSSTSNSWPYSARDDTLANADYLGLKISYTYTYLTAFFAVASPTVNLTADSVQRIEPQQYGDRHDPVAQRWAARATGMPGLPSPLAPSTGLTMARLESERLMGGNA